MAGHDPRDVSPQDAERLPKTYRAARGGGPPLPSTPRPLPPEEPMPWEAKSSPGRGGAQEGDTPRSVRHAAAIVGFLAIAIILVTGVISAQNVRDTPDATVFQLIQVYAEHIFYAVAVIGLVVATYIWSRRLD